jgi:DNA-binding response OmpR family regulator
VDRAEAIRGAGAGTLLGMRLLVAEDDLGLKEVLERGLREAGYVIDAVGYGDLAIEYLRSYEYGVCIVDWRMPDLSGLELITWARAHGIPTPFLMLTAKDAPPDRV